MKHLPVKIVATIGPASHSKEMILDLARAGVDIFRLNLSHAEPNEVAERCQWIREAEDVLQRPLTIIGDLPGPKIRVGTMKPDAVLEKGQTFIISKKIEEGDAHGCGLNNPEYVDLFQEGAEVFMDDGAIKLVVNKKLEDAVETTVVAGGHLRSRKGVAVEGVLVESTGVSEKNKENIKLILEHKIDALAISFTRTKHDVLAVKELLPHDSGIMIIAKIETAMGVENAEEIIEVAHGMMIGRGDLGLSVPIAQVPHIQKRLIDLCVSHGKPVITATQMLESMISRPMPTRAEVTDVANAILDKTDAVMLSAETAEGKFPVETVEMMIKIIAEAVKRIEPHEEPEEKTITNAISYSVGRIAQKIGAKIIIAYTQSGKTASRIAKHRHPQPIIAVSPNPTIIRNLNFVWGVHPHLIHETKGFDGMLSQTKEIAKENRVVRLEAGEIYVISAGMPFGETGTTNMILVENV